MLIERQQILGKIETSDGVPVTPSASDAVLIYDPECDDDVSFLERRPSGSTLSQQFDPAGLTMRRNTFKTDLRGSGAPGTAPEWAKFALASAMQQRSLVLMALTSVSNTEHFMPGEIVWQGSTYATATAVGICVTYLKGVDGSILVVPISGTFAAGTVNGLGSLSVATAGTPTTSGVGFGYVPDSQRVVSVTVDAWSPGAPAIAAVGAVLLVLRGVFVVGAIQVLDAGAGPNWAITFTASLLFGEIADVDNLVSAELGILAAVDGEPIQTRTPSLTIWNNLDGFLRKTAGSRGTFTLEGDAGGPLVFSWDFLGKAVSHSAALPVATGALGSTRPPRLFGAFAAFLYGSQMFRLPVKRIALNQANTVGPREDANAAGGSQGTFVTARRPTLSVEVEMAGMAWDALGFRNNETQVGFAAVLGGNGSGTFAGRTAGNTLVLAAPNCQLKQARPGNSNGVATWQLELEPKKVLDAGDDEVILAAY
jgi:hypothetical protein